jgi:hypothetical protein
MCALAFSLSLTTSMGMALLLSTSAHAEVELPSASPSAKLTQQVGLTEIVVEYNCPAANGRKVWGGVVAFDQVWLPGASAATKIRFNKDVKIGEGALAAGTYWLLAIPGPDAWTFIVNKSPDPVSSVRDYRPELDVSRMKVSPRVTWKRERLTYSFSDVTDDGASLDLEWDGVLVSLPIHVNTAQQMQNAINELDGAWRSYAKAARYMLETKKDYDAGLRYIDKALALKDDWYSMWVKGALLAGKGDFSAARDWAVKARELAAHSGNAGGLEPELDRSIAEWGRKSGRSGRTDREVSTQPKVERPNEDSERPVGKFSDDASAKEPVDTPPLPTFEAGSETSLSLGAPPPLRRARLRHR